MFRLKRELNHLAKIDLIMNKQLIISLLLFVTCISSKGQSWWEWSDPAPLTDSVSDNINADLYHKWSSPDEQVFMVWEKSFDTLSTVIFFDNILDTNDAIAILSDSLIHYSFPRIMDASNAQYPDEEFYIIYETDENGSIDIYYITYMYNGSFSQPLPIINTPDDEKNFDIGTERIWWDKSGYSRNSVSYIRNDSLFIINLMQDGAILYWSEENFIDFPVNDRPLTLGTGYASEVKYLKADTVDKHIFRTWCDQNGNWSSPEVFFDSTDCRNMDDILHYEGLIWSTYRDSVWKITHNSYYPGFYTYNISKETPFDPAAVGFAIGVDFLDGWVFIPYSENDTNEIYISNEPWPWGTEFVDFTNSGTSNRNPNSFEGEAEGGWYYCWYDYLVWESYRNQHWQIWCSKAIQCAGSIEDVDITHRFINSHPNPFTSETTIEFTLTDQELVIADIFDQQGRNVAKIADNIFDPGTHQLRWNASSLPSGVYIVKMMVGERVYTSKIIKSP